MKPVSRMPGQFAWLIGLLIIINLLVPLGASFVHQVLRVKKERYSLGMERKDTIPVKPAEIVNQGDDSMMSYRSKYSQLILHLVHNSPSEKWPVKAGYPALGALLPFNRIVAYYGNLYSSQMGILGALPQEDMLAQLQVTAKEWAAADSSIPVIPALHYIAVTAQRQPGRDSKYRLRMPDTEIDRILQMAAGIHAVVFLDIQVGHSTLQEELPRLEKYLSRPDVYLGIDPEYAMKNGEVPCTVIGTFDATDINYASSWLAGIVRHYHLSPKILVVHRFTQAMVTNYRNIELRPEVQLVMNMDGFGGVAKKRDSYRSWIEGQPVQFTGFKLFFRNDVATGGHMMTPAEVLQLYPEPIYIQYQ